jgi:hypothetical protein
VTCCCGLTRQCAALYLWAGDSCFSQTQRRRLSSVLTFGPDLSPCITVRIEITQAAYDAICTLPLGYENEANERGERLIWPEAAMVDLLFPPSATVLCSARRG